VRSARWSTIALVGAAAIVWLVNLAILSATSEDVLRRNGEATTDPSRLHWIVDHRWGPLVSAARLFSDVGGVAVVAVLAVVVSAVLWWRRVPLAAALVPAAAVASAGIVAAAVKVLVHRPRPGAAYRLVVENDLSFPSGHSTGSMALGVSTAIVVAIYLLRRPLARAAVLCGGVLVPLAVGASRLELGVHWPTDVIAGLALGTLAALTVAGASLWFLGTPAVPINPTDGTSRFDRCRTLLRHQRSARAQHTGDVKETALPGLAHAA
jgi:undecaprenyl-diphosphatase